MHAIYQKAYNNSMSYVDYLMLIDELIQLNKSTGFEQNDMLTDFTKLNRARMKRLDKTQTIVSSLVEVVKNIKTPQIWLVLTESWCGDAAQHIPVFNKLAELNDNLSLRLVLRDDNDELMQQYLTNGGKSIPKLIAVSKDLENELFTWGPRPVKAQLEVKRLLDEHGGFNEKVKESIQIWYNNDKGFSLQTELENIIKKAAL